MTLNGGNGGSRGAGRERDRRRGSTPWGPAPPLHRRSMPVDERDLQAALAPGSLAATTAGTRTQGQRLDWPEGSSDSLSSGGSSSEEGVYKVLLLGAPGVGKSALARIFGGIEDGPDAEAAGHTYDRSITVDGEEASLMVYDIWEQDGGCWLPGHCMAMGDAYVIVYSITDKGSFEKASELRVQLRRARQTDNVPIILVGNKSDLVRSREVSVDEGRACAVVFDCKFIETSAALHHNVQALFEGVVRQIRLRRDSKEDNARRQAGTRRRESLGKKAKRFLGRIVARNSRKMAFRAKSKSCHDLSLPLPLGRDEGQIVLSGDSSTADQELFAVDPDSGFLMVKKALDREEKAEYQLQLVTVHVKDENDQVPQFSQAIYRARLSQGTSPGIPFLFLEASDGDAPGTANSDLRFHILSQSPTQPLPDMFQLDPRLGSLALSPKGLSSTCEVSVMITDINNHAPEFLTSQFGPVSLPEDSKPGVLVATLRATDADLEPVFRLMDFAIEEGDPKGIFDLAWEPDSDHVQLRLQKNLSYEAAPHHKVVVVVRNVEELVGTDPGPGATATVTILVERVMPPLKLDQESYETSIPVSTPAGSLLLTIQLSEPMSRTLRFSLVNDSEGWFCIKEVSGEVHTAQSLQGAKPGDTYTVLVEAQDTDEPRLSASATIVVHFLKASPVPALTLAPGPSRHLCTPREDYGVVVSGASEDHDLANGHGPYSFALGPNPTVQRDWRLHPFNDSHAYLTLALHWVEPGEYMVPVVVRHDAQMWQLQVQVIVCRCNVEGQCMRKVGRMKGMPTKLSAVGVLLGTLAAIGFILILVFTHLALARKKDLDQPADSVPLKAAVSLQHTEGPIAGSISFDLSISLPGLDYWPHILVDDPEASAIELLKLEAPRSVQI
ncbi:cadherin-16 [Cricetulus griseus]|uniref:Cadherin-16 n=1 Tax=Cricetulus griseus TaxID=10029 RepID=A0A061IDK7_CRIGR|nr:cadherin-16 [Cricetulus griseus]